MNRICQRTTFSGARPFQLIAAALLLATPVVAIAKPHVEFDFARVVAARDVTPKSSDGSGRRLVALVLPVSVRFHDVAHEDVDEIHIEINGAAAGLRVHDFLPATQLASDVADAIESTTTVKKDGSIDATLGGQLPVPYAKAVAHVAPSINVGLGKSKVETEKMDRLPPKYAVVVSGTSSEGRGVFFKLKRSSQTTLEGVHELTVVFAVPKLWRGAAVEVACGAHGRRELFWIEQPAVLGSKAGTVHLYLLGNAAGREVVERRTPRVHRTAKPVQPTLFESATAEMMEMLHFKRAGYENGEGVARPEPPAMGVVRER